MEVASVLAVQTEVLRVLLASSKVPLDELLRANLVPMEMPPTTAGGFESELLPLVSQTLQTGLHVALAILPHAKRQSQSALRVHRCNRLERAPFAFA